MSGFGAVLRVSGSRIGLQRFLAKTRWQPDAVFWKGEKRSANSKSVSNINGFNLAVSEARSLAEQVNDVLSVLRRDAPEILRMRRFKLQGVIDFGVELERKDGPSFLRFPSELLQLLARHGLSLEVSCYG
jgi:hypothetical protein